MNAHRQEVMTVTGRNALIGTLVFVSLVVGRAPASAAEYRFEGRVSYVSSGDNNEFDLTGAFQLNERFVLSCKIDPANMLQTTPEQSFCDNCVAEMAFSVGGYSGTMQPGSLSLLRLFDNAAESGNICGGEDPEVDEFLVIATGISGPDVAGVPIAQAGFGLIDCEAEAWASTNLPSTTDPLDRFENRLLILVFLKDSRIGVVYATITDAVVPVARASWGVVKLRYR